VVSAAEAATDPTLETLLLPIDDGRVRWPETGVLFLRARAGAALLRHPRPGLICEQSFRPDAEALQRAGYTVRNHDGVRYALVLVLPPRQRDEARALMARALAATAPGGRIVACVSNVEGARSSEDDFARLLGAIETQSKHKCRVFWSAALQGPADAALAAQWAELDRARPIGDGRFVSRPGVFAWDRIDPASALLAENFGAVAATLPADHGARCL
jgi:16S rRNA (guanine1207-N2)-methyltransferase